MSRAIDELIVFRVMGWVRWTGPSGRKCHGLPNEGGHRDIPEYSTDPAAAMEVVEKMRALGRKVTIETGYFGGKSVWDVAVSSSIKDPGGKSGIAVCETFAEAVCLAALRAVGVPEVEIEKARTL